MLAGGKFERNHSIGAGLTGGVIARISERYKINLALEGLFYRVGDQHDKYSASINQNIKLSRNTSLTIGLAWHESFDEDQQEALIKFNLYH